MYEVTVPLFRQTIAPTLCQRRWSFDFVSERSRPAAVTLDALRLDDLPDDPLVIFCARMQ